MKVVFVALLGIFFSENTRAQEVWESCLDRADFSFSTNSFTNSNRMAKTGCEMQFVEIGGRGKKYIVDLCDPVIHIDAFDSLESSAAIRHYAGSGGCPAPLFGADFRLPKDKKGGEEFLRAKDKIFMIQAAVEKLVDPEALVREAKKLQPSQSLGAEHKLACAQLLLQDYLNKCIAFQGKPAEEKKSVSPSGTGIHPEAIKN